MIRRSLAVAVAAGLLGLTATPSASRSPTPGPTPAPSGPTTGPANGPTTGPTTGPDGASGPPAAAGEVAAATSAPAPTGGGWFDVDPVAAVAVPFGAVSIGCVLWLRRRLGD